MKTIKFFILAVISASCIATLDAQAQGNSLTTSFYATGVTEYRFRGLSLSNKNPAAQGSVVFGHGNFSGGVWASTLSNSVAGADVEVDIYGSYSIPLNNNWSLSVGGTAYTYLGGGNLDYFEANSSLNYSKNAWSTTLGVAYVPEQDNASSRDNIYIYSGATYTLNNRWSLQGTVGYEDGAFGNEKWDWSTGVSYSFKSFTLQATYIDTNVGGTGAAALVGSIGMSF